MLRSQRGCNRLSAALRLQGGVSKPGADGSADGLATHGGSNTVDTRTLLAKKQQQQRRAQTGSFETSWPVLSDEIVKKCSKQDQHKVIATCVQHVEIAYSNTSTCNSTVIVCTS